MSLTITMTREGRHLVPTAEMWAEDMEKIPEKREIVVTIKRSRSPKHLRTFFGKLRAAIDLGLWDGDADSLRQYISIGIGHCTTVIDNTSSLVSDRILALAQAVVERHGRESEEGRLAEAITELAGPRSYLIPKSISEESMGQDEFNDYNDRADRFLAEHGIDPQLLYQHMVDKSASRADHQSDRVNESVNTDIEKPLDERLRAVGFELGFAITRTAMDQMWQEAKARAEVKALHQRAPGALKSIVDAARSHADGEITQARFEATVKAAAEAALESEGK